MKAMKFLNRRRFLRGMAGVTVGLPLLESVGRGPLGAQGAAPVTRFLSFHCSSGVETDRFWPGIGNLTANSFAGKGTDALAPYAGRLLIPRGVHGYPVGTWTGHLEGTGQALTAARIGSSELAQGVSIDQIIASELNPPGREALVLKPGGRDLGVPMFNSISYRAPGQMANAESNPWLAYRAMMGASNSGTDGEGSEHPMQDLVLRRRQSVIDLARAEFEELQAMNLSQRDREKLDAHFSLLRDTEVDMSDPTGPITCDVDAQTLGMLEAIDGSAVERNENFASMARLHVKVAALALACGYTRSAVIQWGAAVAGSPMYTWDGMSHNYRHHPLSHGTTDDFNEQAVSGYKEMLFEIDRWNIGEFKALLDLLDSYSEGEKTLLDNTVVLYTNEFSHGQGHTTGDLPIIIVGGAGYFKRGVSQVVGNSSADIAGGNGNSNKLLATVLNAVGIPTTQFSDGPSGEFTELKA
jgi:hypothetical protein